jgi:hypothetical protein
MVAYFMSVWSILRPFGIFGSNLVYFIVIWYIFFCFGMLYQEKLATLPAKTSTSCTAFIIYEKHCERGTMLLLLLFLISPKKLAFFGQNTAILQNWIGVHIRKLAHIFSQNIAEDREKFLL